MLLKKIHVGDRVLVEWDINGLKHKCKCLMKLFDSMHLKYSHFFGVGCLITNYLHMRRMGLPCMSTMKKIEMRDY